MRVAVIGATGKTGRHLVRTAAARGHEVVAVCRDASVDGLAEFRGAKAVTVASAPVVSDAAMLSHALSGCDAVVAILLAVRKLKATELVTSLAAAGAAAGVSRFLFTAGEVTTVREEGETFTPRQRIMRAVFPVISAFTPFSMTDMIRASELVRQQREWAWTIVRAPTLTEEQPSGYRWCALREITGTHSLARGDYAACLLDSIGRTEHHRRILTVAPAGSGESP